MGHRLGRVVVAAELVGQPGVRVDRDGERGDPGEIRDVGSERLRAEGAVQPDDDRAGVGDRRPECLDGLAAERPAGSVDDRARQDEREADSGGLEGGLDAEDRGLAVERVEDRLDQEDVGAALDQALGRLLVGGGELLERDVAGGGVVHVGRDRGRPVRRPEGAGDEPRPAGFRGLRGVGGFAGDPGGRGVHLADEGLQGVVGLGDPRRRERVRLDDVRAGVEIGVVDRPDDPRLGQRQEVVVAAEVARMVAEPRVAAALALAAPSRCRRGIPPRRAGRTG